MMIFQLLRRLRTDVWFCFPGFMFGAQCLIEECTKDFIILSFKPRIRNYDKEFLRELPALLNHPFPRMRSELRLYFPRKFAEVLACERTVILITEKKPEILTHELNIIRLRFIKLKGSTILDSQQWKKIITHDFKTGFDNF